MQQITLSQIPAQSFNVVLAGQDCTIGLRWRQTRLYLDLDVNQVLESNADASGSPASGGSQVPGGSPASGPETREICRGALCQNRAAVLQSPSRYFSGSLHFLDLEGEKPPHWQQLHTGSEGRHVLLYIGEDEELPLALRF